LRANPELVLPVSTVFQLPETEDLTGEAPAFAAADDCGFSALSSEKFTSRDA
jgi:hypothetical protein